MEQAGHVRGENRAESWSSILAFYQDLTAHGFGHEMLALTQHIISSGAATRLFAYTSMHTLKVGIYESRPAFKEELIVEFDPLHKLFHFEYHGRPEVYGQPEFQRHYAPEVVNEKFDQFIRWIRW